MPCLISALWTIITPRVKCNCYPEGRAWGQDWKCSWRVSVTHFGGSWTQAGWEGHPRDTLPFPNTLLSASVSVVSLLPSTLITNPSFPALKSGSRTRHCPWNGCPSRHTALHPVWEALAPEKRPQPQVQSRVQWSEAHTAVRVLGEGCRLSKNERRTGVGHGGGCGGRAEPKQRQRGRRVWSERRQMSLGRCPYGNSSGERGKPQ